MCNVVLGSQIEETGAKLIIVDSIATFFRSEYGSQRQKLPERQQKVNEILHDLKRHTKLNNAVTIITNQASGDVSGFGSPIKHSMGHVVGHESEVRISVSVYSTAKNERKFKVDKAVDLPKESVVLVLKEDGYHDLDATAAKKGKSKKKGTAEETEAEEPAREDAEEETEENSDEAESDPDDNPPKQKLVLKKKPNKK